jgi:hypothetical protein
MRTIAIVHGDNDFGTVYQTLLKTVLDVIEYHGGVIGKQITREFIERVIREGIRFHYIAYQYRYDLDPHKEEEIAKIVEYLSSLKVLFDEEAEDDILIGDHDGGAAYLEMQSRSIKLY